MKSVRAEVGRVEENGIPGECRKLVQMTEMVKQGKKKGEIDRDGQLVQLMKGTG